MEQVTTSVTVLRQNVADLVDALNDIYDPESGEEEE